MPANANVFLHYGPYEACGVVDHRQSRLQGLQTVLVGDDHQVEFVQINDRNVVELWVSGQLIFKCDARNLDYGGDGDLDVLCAEALQKVKEAY